MNKHPDCEDRCQILEHKGYHTCSQTGRCENLEAERTPMFNSQERFILEDRHPVHREPDTREAGMPEEPTTLNKKMPSAPEIGELWDSVRRSLGDASKAFPVLLTMLKTANLKGGAMVADEMFGNVRYALKAFPALRTAHAALREENEKLRALVKVDTLL